jgi:lysophospholipase L1-like esterase
MDEERTKPSTIVFQPQQKLLFIGDSITDCGRQSDQVPLGNGYVYQVYLWLSAGYPELHLTLVNKGVSGDTIRDLARRWPTDVIRERPHWLFVKIGINDVWRYFSDQTNEAVAEAEFEHTYRELLRQTRRAGQPGLVLIEPFLVTPALDDLFRQRLAPYQRIVRRLAQEFDALFVPTQAAFDEGLASRPVLYWTEDHVHPTPIGHMLIAQQVVGAVGAK